jgi:hypothetical protein
MPVMNVMINKITVRLFKQGKFDINRSILFETSSHTEITIIPSIPTCDNGRSRSALCLKIATTVAAIENDYKCRCGISETTFFVDYPG